MALNRLESFLLIEWSENVVRVGMVGGTLITYAIWEAPAVTYKDAASCWRRLYWSAEIDMDQTVSINTSLPYSN